MSNKDGSFIKRIVTEVIAERDAQIAAALFEVAKNQPHLQMMVQTVYIKRGNTIFPYLFCPLWVVKNIFFFAHLRYYCYKLKGAVHQNRNNDSRAQKVVPSLPQMFL